MCALPILWLSSTWLSSASIKTSLRFLSPFIFIQVFRDSSESIVITAYSAVPSPPNSLSCTAHPSIIVPMDPFHPANSLLSLRSCLSPCAMISRLLCCSCAVHDIWTSAAYILFLMSFPIVFSWNYSAPPSLLKFFPGLPSCHPWKPISVLSRCFFLLPICFPFTAL